MKKILTITLAIFLFACFSTTALAQKHKAGAKKARHGKASVSSTRRAQAFHPRGWHPSLRGSAASQIRQNKVADLEGLSRIKNEGQLRKLERSHKLVPLPTTRGLRIDPRLAAERRFVRPETRRFLVKMGAAYYSRFHDALQINSAVRTLDFQRKLKGRGRNHNPNAAAVTGPKASSHPSGATVDIARNIMNAREAAWTRFYLLGEEKQDHIEVTEEHVEPVFHFMVFDATDRASTRKNRVRTARR